MSKADFLSQLRQRLGSLPPGEMQDALDYYDGYISDAGDEAAAIAQLGSPAEVASQILAAYVTKRTSPDAPKGKGPGAKTAWGILLVLLSPVALPLAASAIMLIIALFIVILAIGISGVAAIVAGVAALGFTVFAFFQAGILYAITLGGSGVAAIGLGLLLIAATKALWDVGVNGLLKFVSKKITKKR